jgi:hypothetical protein
MKSIKTLGYRGAWRTLVACSGATMLQTAAPSVSFSQTAEPSCAPITGCTKVEETYTYWGKIGCVAWGSQGPFTLTSEVPRPGTAADGRWLELNVYGEWYECYAPAPNREIHRTVVPVKCPSEELYISNGCGLNAVDSENGRNHPVDQRTADPHAVAALGDFVYEVVDGKLTQFNVNTRAVSPFKLYADGWAGTEAMTALGDSLYIVQGGTLWRARPSDGWTYPFSAYPDGWSGTEAMAASGGFLYLVQGGTLWSVHVASGAVDPLGAYPHGWEGTEALAARGDFVYAVQGGTLWSVHVPSGAVDPFSAYPHGWEGTEAMAARGDFVYAVQGGTLWSVHIPSGSVDPLGGSWTAIAGIVAR